MIVGFDGVTQQSCSPQQSEGLSLHIAEAEVPGGGKGLSHQVAGSLVVAGLAAGRRRFPIVLSSSWRGDDAEFAWRQGGFRPGSENLSAMRVDWTTMLAACILTFILGLGTGMYAPAIFDCLAGGANALCPSDD